MNYKKGDGLLEDQAAIVATRRESRYIQLAQRVDGKIGRIAAARFIAFVIAAASLFSAWYDQNWETYGVPALLGIITFGVTVWLHRRLYHLLPKAQAQAEIAHAAAARLRHQWSQISEGGERYAQGRPAEQELQIFGEVSLFKLLNRAHLRGAQVMIARRLLRSSTSSQIIDYSVLKDQQSAIDELKILGGLRRRLLGATKQSQPEGDARSQALGLHAFATWAKSYRLDKNQLRRLRGLAWLGLGLTVATIVQGVISATTELETAWRITLGAQFVLYIITTSKVTPQYIELISEAHKPLQGLESCFSLIESRTFASPWLKQWSEQLNTRGTPSMRIRSIAQSAEALAVRHSALLYGVLSIGLLWELWHGSKVAVWRAEYGESIGEDLDALYEFEVLCSLADFASDHPGYVWPSIAPYGQEGALLKATAIAHPLFHPRGRVPNDFNIERDTELYLITGSNMSGKSSFMRAVASNVTLALAGAPVCATQLSCPPLAIASSIQVTDDPSRGWSRFYAEVRRIREVIESAESVGNDGRPVLYLIDEMLSGTNSRERRLASRTIATRLLSAKRSAGIITTHDLDLAQLLERFPDQLKLAHFSDHFDGEALHFDYTLHPGVAQTTNALHVLAMEGIDVEEPDHINEA